MIGRVVDVGVDYCVAHHGIREPDEDACDFVMRGRVLDLGDTPCRLVPLVYRKRDARKVTP